MMDREYDNANILWSLRDASSLRELFRRLRQKLRKSVIRFWSLSKVLRLSEKVDLIQNHECRKSPLHLCYTKRECSFPLSMWVGDGLLLEQWQQRSDLYDLTISKFPSYLLLWSIPEPASIDPLVGGRLSGSKNKIGWVVLFWRTCTIGERDCMPKRNKRPRPS